jgi:SAM-dependent methyltransferase
MHQQNVFLDNYIHCVDVHNTKSAYSFIPILLKYINLPNSVIDIGCGTGTWLNALKNFGVKDIKGINGNYIENSLLEINVNELVYHDLNLPYLDKKKYDLAICLEVAEHLQSESSDILVKTLCKLSDTILFSAALPFQGGQNHLNEQPIKYWIDLFNRNGFIFKDYFRSTIWDNENIEWWYRQNTFLIIKDQTFSNCQDKILEFYHPDAIKSNHYTFNKFKYMNLNFSQGLYWFLIFLKFKILNLWKSQF